MAVANCSAFEVNHRRLGVQFAVHFLPMPCYRWLGGCGGVQFFGVFLLLRKPPFYGLKELLLSFYGLRKVRYMLTICAMRSPVVLVVGLSIQWLNVAIWGNKKGHG